MSSLDTKLKSLVLSSSEQNEPLHGKTYVLVSNMLRHKPGCTVTEDGQRLEILDLERRGIVLSM